MDKTLLKGLKIIEILARSEMPRGVTDLATETRLEKSNIHRVLTTLDYAGYLKRDPSTGRYHLSLKLWELGTGLLSNLNIRQAAQPYLPRLAANTRETVTLAVLDGNDVVYLDKIDSPEPVRAYAVIGGRAPAFASSTGKAIVAFQPASKIEEIGRCLQPFTRKTVGSLEALQRQLARVRAQGCAINRGEWRESVYGVAAPIRIADGTVEAAIGVSGPSTRMNPKVIKRVAEEVIAATSEISRKLGYTEP